MNFYVTSHVLQSAAGCAKHAVVAVLPLYLFWLTVGVALANYIFVLVGYVQA